MKIIELLNLIHKGKQPNRVIYKGEEYIWCRSIGDYRKDGCFECLIIKEIFEFNQYNHNSLYNMIKDEVEIIEDKPEKIEKINNILRFDDLRFPYGENEEKFWKNIIINHNKINEVIDKLNYLLEKSDNNENNK